MGKKLMLECLGLLGSKGAKCSRTALLTENEAAVRLYEKLGFRICRYTMMSGPRQDTVKTFDLIEGDRHPDFH